MPTPTLTILPGQLGRNDDVPKRSPTLEEVHEGTKRELLGLLEFVVDAAAAKATVSFKEFEHGLRERVRTVARLLIVLFLRACEQRVVSALGMYPRPHSAAADTSTATGAAPLAPPSNAENPYCVKYRTPLCRLSAVHASRSRSRRRSRVAITHWTT